MTQGIFNRKEDHAIACRTNDFFYEFSQPRDARWGITRVRTCLRATEDPWTLLTHFLPSSSARRGLSFMFTSSLGLDVSLAPGSLLECLRDFKARKIGYSRLPIIRTFKGNRKKLQLYIENDLKGNESCFESAFGSNCRESTVLHFKVKSSLPDSLRRRRSKPSVRGPAATQATSGVCNSKARLGLHVWYKQFFFQK